MSKFLVKCTVIVISILFGVCLYAKEPQLRYHGLKNGIPFPIHEHPYMVALAGNMRKRIIDAHHIETTYYACTGVLVTLEWVVAGYRCYYRLKDYLDTDLFLTAGSNLMDYKSGVEFKGQIRLASKILYWLDFTHIRFQMCLFKAEKPFLYNKLVQPVKFSKSLNYTFENCRVNVDVFGFAPFKDNEKIYVQRAALPLLKYDICAKTKPDVKTMSHVALCVDTVLVQLQPNTDTNENPARVVCREDFGMPVFCKGLFVGFTNPLYNLPFHSFACTPAEASSVFLWTDNFLKWVGNRSGIKVDYTTTTTTTTTTIRTTNATPTHPRTKATEAPNGTGSLSTQKPLLVLIFVYLCLYLI